MPKVSNNPRARARARAAARLAPPPVPPAQPVPAYDETIALAICRSVRAGVPLPAACLCGGITPATGEAWRAHHPDFSHRLDRAQALHLRALLRRIGRGTAGPGVRHDWRASLALLERQEKSAAHADGSTPSSVGSAQPPVLFTPAQIAALQTRRAATLRTIAR